LYVDEETGNIYIWNGLSYSTADVAPDHGLLLGLGDDDHTQYMRLSGRVSGQTLIGGTAASENLTLSSTGNATKGAIIFGDSRYNEATNRLILGAATGTGRINLPDAGTTSADGITFGTDVVLFRSGANTLRTNSSLNVTGSIFNSATGILLISSSQSITGNSLTGSSATSALSITQTWNTTGNPTAILLNVTNTASGASANLIDLQVGGVSQFKVDKNGNAGFSTTPNASFRVDVSGDLRATNLHTGIINARSSLLQYVSAGSTNVNQHIFGTSASQTITSGETFLISSLSTFNPTSGNGVYSNLRLTPTINQTGGANGITRGLHISPTLTSAADWRAIEATGRVIFTGETLTGSSATSLLSLTQTWNTTGNPTAIDLNITDTASGASANLADFKVGGVSQFRVDKTGTIITNRIGKNTNRLIDFTNGNSIRVSSFSNLWLSTFNSSSTYEDIVILTGNISAPYTNIKYQLGVGKTTAPLSSALIDMESTTQGFLPPRMTTAQINAIASPAPGLLAINTNLNKLVQFNGTIWEQVSASALAKTGVVISYEEDAVYGTIASPETGNITSSLTNAKLGVTNIIIHNSGTAPTFGAEFKKLSGSGNYVVSVINYIYCTYINATEVIYSIN
jgi:hypothetical protein